MITQEKLIQQLVSRAQKAGSQKKLAEDMHVDPSALSQILNGRRDPTARVLAALGYERVVRYRRRGNEDTKTVCRGLDSDKHGRGFESH